MSFTRIVAGDLTNKGVTGLPDVPLITAAALRAKFDELVIDVIVPKFNDLLDELEAGISAESLGAKTLLDVDTTIQALLDASNFGGKTAQSTVTNDDTKIPTSSAIVAYMVGIGAGDMQKAVYDTNNSGVVDNSEALAGHDDTYYGKQSDIDDLLVCLAATNQKTYTSITQLGITSSYVGDIITAMPTGSTFCLGVASGSAFANETKNAVPTYGVLTIMKNDTNVSVCMQGQEYFYSGKTITDSMSWSRMIRYAELANVDYTIATGDWQVESGGFYASKTLTGATTASLPNWGQIPVTGSTITSLEKTEDKYVDRVTYTADTMTYHALTTKPTGSLKYKVKGVI